MKQMIRKCEHDFGEVINSRKRDGWIYRRRVCRICGENFSSAEFKNMKGGLDLDMVLAFSKMSRKDKLFINHIMQIILEGKP